MAFKVNTSQAIKNWDSYYENFLASISAEQNETDLEKKKRIASLERNPEKWKRYYFPKYCYAPAADFHVAATKRELNNPEWYEVRIWARELAKDVVEMMNTLYQVLTGAKSNVLFISNSWDKAAELLEPYRINLERNERIINDYGYQKMPGSWTYGDFVTTQKASFLAVGADQSPRGSRNEDVRPDKVIISDIDTDEDVRNTEIVKKRWAWFEHAVFPTRSVSKPFQVIFLGNLMAKYCCISLASEKADRVDRVNLEDKNGDSTWPDKNTKDNIERIKAKISYIAYQAEYMNNPLSEGAVFKEIIWDTVPKLSAFRFLVCYGDPSPKNNENKSGSFKAVFLVGFLNNTYYIITGFLDQTTNKKFVSWYWDIDQWVGQKSQVYNSIENNSLQNPFYEQVLAPLFLSEGEEKGKFIAVSPDERRKPDKFSRIEGNLEPVNRRGGLVFNLEEKANPHMLRLEEQFKTVDPKLSAPADGPDAIEGAVWIINNKIAALGEVKTGKPKRNPKRY